MSDLTPGTLWVPFGSGALWAPQAVACTRRLLTLGINVQMLLVPRLELARVLGAEEDSIDACDALRKDKAGSTCSYVLKRFDILNRAVDRVEAK